MKYGRGLYYQHLASPVVQQYPEEAKEGFSGVTHLDSEGAEIKDNVLFIHLKTLPSDPDIEDFWKLIEKQYLRLEREGRIFRYSELYSEMPTIRRYKVDDLIDSVFTHPELGTLATFRLIHEHDSFIINKMFLWIPLQFADGSKLAFTHTIEELGVFWPKHSGKVNPPDTDYEGLVGTIIETVNGIVTYDESERIFSIFQKQDAAGLRSLIDRLKYHSYKLKKTPETVIQHLFSKLSANHRDELKDLLITHNVTEDLVGIVVRDMIDDLLSEDEKLYHVLNRTQTGDNLTLDENPIKNNEELYRWLMRFHGPALDELLLELEKQSGKNLEQTIELVFHHLETLSAEKVREHFFANGTSRATEYALGWTVVRINNLLEGYTGILDSGSILWNFKQIPANMRPLVMERLNNGDSSDIATHLMGKLQPEDYAELQKLGLNLPKNTKKETILDRTLEAGEWFVIALEVIAGGLVGIVTGSVEFAWDIFKGIVDIPTGAYHYFMTLLFMSSKGSIGSDSVLKIEEFIRAVDGFVGDPRAVIEMAFEQTMEESEAFEGTLEAFQRAEYWSRMTVKFIENVYIIIRSVQAIQQGLPVKGEFELSRTGHMTKEMEARLQSAYERFAKRKGIRKYSPEELENLRPDVDQIKKFKSEKELIEFANTELSLSEQHALEMTLIFKRTDLPSNLLTELAGEISLAVEYKSLHPESLNRMLSRLRREKAEKVVEVLAELKEANRVALYGESASFIRVGEMKMKEKIKEAGRVIEVGGHKTSIDPLNEADVLFYGSDKKMHVHEVKNTASALRDSIKNKPQQLENLLKWRSDHLTSYKIEGEITYVINTRTRWGQLFSETTYNRKKYTIIGVLAKEKIPLVIEGKRWEVDRLQKMADIFKLYEKTTDFKWLYVSNDLSDAEKLLKMGR